MATLNNQYVYSHTVSHSCGLWEVGCGQVKSTWGTVTSCCCRWCCWAAAAAFGHPTSWTDGETPQTSTVQGMLQQEITRNTLPIPAQELLNWRLVLLIKLLMFDVHIAAPRTVWFSSCARMVGLHVLACMGLLALLIMFGKLDMFWNCCSGSSSETSVVETLIGDSPQSIVTHKIGKSVQYSYIYKD